MRKLPANGTPDSSEVSDALLTLQDMLHAWESDGVNMWRTVNKEITLVQGQAKYQLDTPRALGVEEVRLRQMLGTSQNDTPMFNMTADTYKNLPNKTVQGFPSQYWLSRGPSVWDNTAPSVAVDNSWLYIWPTPSASVVASPNSGTLQMTVQVPFQIPQLEGDTIDLPQEWYDAIAFNLAERLSFEYAAPNHAEIAAKAFELYDMVKDFDRPDAIYVVPENPWAS